MNGIKLSLLCATVVVCLLGAAHASIRDSDIRTARQCTQYFAQHERLNGIPSHLLAAISATESGRYNKQVKMVLPWPWTINAEGKGHYFNSKAEAIRKVREYQAQGVKSIDIGCMQVNLKHHPDAFASLEQAFDPRYNVAYAAKFLKSNFDEAGSWNKAIQYYHSRTPKYGLKYLGHIQKNWGKISGKIRTALHDTDEATRPSKSYRLIEVSDSDSGKRSGELKISSLAPRPSMSLSKKTDHKMMRIQDVDRLSGFKRRTIKDIKVSGKTNHLNSSKMLVVKAKKEPTNIDGPVKVTSLKPKPSDEETFVDAPQQSKKTEPKPAPTKEIAIQKRKFEPKFVFVQ